MSTHSKGFYKCTECLTYLPENGNKVAKHYLDRHKLPFSKTTTAKSVDGRLALQPKPEYAELTHFPKCYVILYQTKTAPPPQIKIEDISIFEDENASEKLILPPPHEERTPEDIEILRNNVKKPKTAPFACPVCSKSFGTNNGMQKHILSHKPFACHPCNLKNQTQFQLSAHVQNCHNTKISRIPPREHESEDPSIIADSSEKSLLSPPPQETEEVDIMRNNSKNLPKTSKVTCPICSKSFEKNYVMQKHILTHRHRPFACHLCELKYQTQFQLCSHLQNCHQKAHSSCDECSKTVKTLEDKEPEPAEVIVKSEPEDLVEINQTNKTYLEPMQPSVALENNSESQTCQETEEIHILNEYGKYECGICQKVFKDLHNLQRHTALALHKECKECGKKMRNKWALKAHMKTHSKNDFHTGLDLRRHEKSHGDGMVPMPMFPISNGQVTILHVPGTVQDSCTLTGHDTNLLSQTDSKKEGLNIIKLERNGEDSEEIFGF